MTKKPQPVVIYGAQNYCAWALKRLQPGIRPTHIIPDGPNTLSASGLQEIALSDLPALDDPLVLIARFPNQHKEIRVLAENLRAASVRFDHISNWCSNAVIVSGLLNDMAFVSYQDQRANTVQLGTKVPDNIHINFLRDCVGCNVVIGDALYVRRGLTIDFFGSNASVEIGGRCSFIEASIEAGMDGKISVGNDCMLSFGIIIGQPDHHPIFDLATHRRINDTKDIMIGDHVWVGRDVRILGGANIGSGCVVGTASVTSSRFANNVVLAGSPARTLRTGVLWARDTVASQTLDIFEQCRDQSAVDWLDSSAR